MLMTENLHHTYHAEDLFCGDQPQLEQMVEKFAGDGPSNLIGVFDFDKNMTTNGPKSLTSWDAASHLMSPDARLREDEMNAKYMSLEERRGTDEHGNKIGLTLDDALAWWEETLDLYKSERVNFNRMVDYGGENIQLREGVTDLFKLFESANVPTVIVSAGLKAIIERVAEKNSINPDLIVSTDIIADDEGRIVDWDRDQVVHNHNKWQRSREQMAGLLAVRKNVILTGDSFEDPKMVEETADNGLSVIRIRVGDPYKITPRAANEYFEGSFEAGYDAISVNGMAPVLRMSKLIVGQSLEEIS